MSLARLTPLPRMRPALAALGLGLLGLTMASPVLAGDAAASTSRADMGAAGGLRVSQAMDPYAASPSGYPAPGTPGSSSSDYGPYESRSSTLGAPSSGRSGSWWMPGGGRTSVGLNLGRSRFDTRCDPGFSCDDKDIYVALTARNMATEHVGGEIGLVHMGRMERGGGHTRATGLNLSLVGKTGSLTGGSGTMGGLGAFGKIGGVWGRTRTSLAPGSTLAGGTENGFGLSLGAGLSWDFSPRTSAVLEVDRYWFRFPGSGRDPVNMASIGLQWRY